MKQERLEKNRGRKRPIKAHILKAIENRGHATPKEEVLLKGLEIKNMYAKINNKAFNGFFNKINSKQAMKIIDTFTKEMEEILNKK